MTPAPHAARMLLATLAVLALDFGLLALGVGGLAPLMHHARALALFATWLVAAPALALLRPVRSHDAGAARPPRLGLGGLFLIPPFTPMLLALPRPPGPGFLPGRA